jgi:HEAT repeat protein
VLRQFYGPDGAERNTDALWQLVHTYYLEDMCQFITAYPFDPLSEAMLHFVSRLREPFALRFLHPLLAVYGRAPRQLAAAIQAIGRIGSNTSGEQLIPYVGGSYPEEVRIAAIIALGNIKWQRARLALRRCAWTALQTRLRIEAIYALAELGSQDDIPFLTELIDADSDEDVRGAAARTIAFLKLLY